ncbi:hypothetical protein [Mycobacterium gordonae]|uniref:hypothetical protein n=1 Tax=Mycobacterium gordonae TaxID=1778 RepID=UPI0009F4C1B8|nr:hypothetical protein [Mycobacterium gordonae]MBI2698422.1 hypothetical protein [Mycobacterium sp.]MBX9983349.1 hypothetical protein [Mycobacterium gordonae]MCQ4362320.1 hypothetical protein [Mycobacterium gordonae]MCV7006159.1 hypothetical protein [Mycobacterium gordonae]
MTAGRSTVGQRHPASARIVRRDHLNSASLGPAQLGALVDTLYDIYRQSARGCSRDEFAAVVFSAGDGRFMLFYDERDQCAGFSYVAFDHLERENIAVINAGVFFRPGYRGGAMAGLFGLGQALRFKVRSPRTPLAYATRSSSPAVYRLLASTMPRLYPSRSHSTPPEVERLAMAASRRRHYEPIGADPWVVRSDAVPLDVSRMQKLRGDPHVRFFTAMAPRYTEGEAVVVWIPLDVANILVGVLRLVRARLAR